MKLKKASRLLEAEERQPAITFENANASYLAQGLQQAGATYHCLRVTDLIHLTYDMRATLRGARSRRPIYWGVDWW